MNKKQKPSATAQIIAGIIFLFFFVLILRSCFSEEKDQWDARKLSCACEVDFLGGQKKTSNSNYERVEHEINELYYMVKDFDPSNISCWGYLQEFSLLHKNNTSADYLTITFYDTSIDVSSKNDEEIYMNNVDNMIARYSKNIDLAFFEPMSVEAYVKKNKNWYGNYFSYEELSFSAKKYDKYNRKLIK